jgi:hypothetical protein
LEEQTARLTRQSSPRHVQVSTQLRH